MDLIPEEATDLRRYFPLYRNWGYRAGPNRVHERFEVESGNFRWVQEFTDILFRNLQQLDMDGVKTMRYGDFEGKVRSASSTVDMVRDDEELLQGGMKLVKTFLDQTTKGGAKRKTQTIDLTQSSDSNSESKKPRRETNRTLLERLADTDTQKASVMYACFVYAAKAILALSEFRADEAQNIMTECESRYFSQDGGKFLYQTRLRKIHVGPRNGKYVIVKGTKTYIKKGI